MKIDDSIIHWFLPGFFDETVFFDVPVEKSVFYSVKKDLCIIWGILSEEISLCKNIPMDKIPKSFWYAMGVYARRIRSCGNEILIHADEWAKFNSHPKFCGCDEIVSEWVESNNITIDLLISVSSTMLAKDFDPFVDKVSSHMDTN